MSPGDDELPRGKTVFPSLVQVHFDGACEPARGGGIATYGFTVEGSGLKYEEFGLAVPPWSPRATNNVAEYSAATRALEWLAQQGFRGQVVLLGDSELVVRQMQGEYRVRAEHLRAYKEHLDRLVQRFEGVRFGWIPREENTRADELSKRAFEQERRSAGRHRPPTLPAPLSEDDGEWPSEER
ncbi:MAG TPA: ribonuclease HI [Thermoplasmata archaeon]|nr:ribonuclease HI [Thermoplasmata archaeon]